MFEAIYTILYTFIEGTPPTTTPTLKESWDYLVSGVNQIMNWFNDKTITAEEIDVIAAITVVFSVIVAIAVVLLIFKVFKRLLGLFTA